MLSGQETCSSASSIVSYPRLSFDRGRVMFGTLHPAEATPSTLKTPGKHSPNIGRRRHCTTDLSRSEPTASHRVKMASIFQDAATNLRTPPRSSLLRSRRLFSPPDAISPSSKSSNTKWSRLPRDLGKDLISPPATSPIRAQESESSSGQSACLPISFLEEMVVRAHGSQSPILDRTSSKIACSASEYLNNIAPEPLSSGFTSPIGVCDQTICQAVGGQTSLEEDLDAEETHSTHGVPLIIPIRVPEDDFSPGFSPKVDAWLEQVVAHTMFSHTNIGGKFFKEPNLDAAEYLMTDKSSPRQTSNKENVPPATIALSWSSLMSSSSQSPLATQSSQPLVIPPRPPKSNSPRRNISAAGSPSMLLSAPPKSKKPKAVMSNTGATVEVKKKNNKSKFDICESDVADSLMQLSPHVECHRKGKGPKKERCLSYMDQDVLPECSPSRRCGRGENMSKGLGTMKVKAKGNTSVGKKVLGENARNAVLTGREI